MTFNKEKIIIRPEKLFEYEKVDKLIYKAFAEQHSIETGKFMMEHFREERKKDTFIPFSCCCIRKRNNCWRSCASRNRYCHRKWKYYAIGFSTKCCFARI